jgi:predicted RNA-binding Zn ribbon-like protein
LLRVANLTLPRKPVGSPRTHPDPFSSPGALARALGLERVEHAQMEHLRALHAAVVELVDRLLAGQSVASQADRLTQLAAASSARTRLEPDGGALRARLEWSDPDPVSALARRLISELGTLDIGRLRRCARPECDLVFYDTTRSGTRRWHAESPCGVRERQRRHRQRRRSEPARA